MARIVQLPDGVATTPFEIDKPEIRIGRSPECDVHIDDRSVSSLHCVIETVAVFPETGIYRLRPVCRRSMLYGPGGKG